MIYIKQFDKKHVILSDGENDHDLYAGDNEEFDIDILEEILKQSLQEVSNE